MRATKLNGIAYLENTLKWTAFCKAHPKYAVALRQALDELYCLRNTVSEKKIRGYRQ